MSEFFRRINGDQELVGDSAFRKFKVERLSEDPEAKFAGRSWYNTTSKRYKFSSLDDDNMLVVRTFACIDDLINQMNGQMGWAEQNSPLSTTGRSKGKKEPTWEPFRGGMYALTFPSSRTLEVNVAFCISHGYMSGTSIFPNICWSPENNIVGNVQWGIEYSIARTGKNEPFPLTKTIYINHVTPGVSFANMMSEVSEADSILEGVEVGSTVLIRIFRNGGNDADTYNGKVYIHNAGIQYLSDTHTTATRKGS